MRAVQIFRTLAAQRINDFMDVSEHASSEIYVETLHIHDVETLHIHERVLKWNAFGGDCVMTQEKCAIIKYRHIAATVS